MNDFIPTKIYLSENEGIGNTTNFENLEYSYVLNDLARSLAHFMISNQGEISFLIKAITNGYQAIKILEEKDKKLLYYLVLVQLSFEILENETLTEANCHLFEIFYLNEKTFSNFIE